MLNQTRCQ